MAKATISLSDLRTKYRGAGVYTIFSDETVQPNTSGSGQVVRLVMGFSKVGWFNRPFYIEQGDYTTARLLFGERDRSLERKGSFFHKSLEVALAAGPILAMNLHPFNNELDEHGQPKPTSDSAEYQSFSVDASEPNGEKVNKLYASYFQKERFYIPRAEYLLATRNGVNQNKILSLVNLSQNKVSFIIKKANVKGYDITAREWYVGDNIPAFIRPADLISDYFVEVIMISGDFGKGRYQSLSVDSSLGQFFTKDGLKADKLEQFLNRNEVVIKNRVVGCLIPDFRAKDGSNLFIETMINASVLSTGVICAIDRDQIENYEYGTNDSFVDLIGNRLLDKEVEAIDCLSYHQNLKSEFTYDFKELSDSINIKIDEEHSTLQQRKDKWIITLNSGTENFEKIKNSVEVGSVFIAEANGIPVGHDARRVEYEDNVQLVVSRVTKTNNQIIIELSNDYNKEAMYNGLGNAVKPKKLNETPEVQAVATFSAFSLDNAVADVQIEISLDSLPDGWSDKFIPEQFTLPAGDKTAIIEAFVAATTRHGFSISKLGDQFVVTAPKGIFGSIKRLTSVTVMRDSGKNVMSSTSFSKATPSTFELQYYPKNDRIFVKDNGIFCNPGSQLYKDYIAGLLNGKCFTYEQGSVNANELAFDTKETSKIVGNPVLRITYKNPSTSYSTKQFAQKDSTIISDGFAIYKDTIPMFKEVAVTDASGNTFTLVDDPAEKDKLKVGRMVVGVDADDNPILARITKIVVDKVAHTMTCTTDYDVKVEADKIKVYTPFENVVQNLNIFCLNGFNLSKSALPDGTNKKMKEIYSTITESNIGRALTDPELVNFRYIIDTFNGGLEPKSKSYLTELAKKRQRCLALLNAPTVREFRRSNDPRFTTTPTAENPYPEFAIKYVVSGGNQDENPSWSYSLPDEEQGASFAGFFFPNIVVTEDDGTTTAVPPAAFVSNAFMRKYGTTDEYKPVAGIIRGQITGAGVSGVDHPLMSDEYNELIEFGINPIITKNGVLTIYGNETAYQRFTSILNNIHARDTLITFEIETEKLLLPYVWDYNDDTMRSTVSQILRKYYDAMRDSYHAIEDYELIFDRSNNPDFVINESAAIVDIAVKITGVTRKFINRLTLRGQSVTQSGFTVV